MISGDSCTENCPVSQLVPLVQNVTKSKCVVQCLPWSLWCFPSCKMSLHPSSKTSEVAVCGRQTWDTWSRFLHTVPTMASLVFFLRHNEPAPLMPNTKEVAACGTPTWSCFCESSPTNHSLQNSVLHMLHCKYNTTLYWSIEGNSAVRLLF